MAKNITEQPFTELVERAALIARATDPRDASRVRGAINDEYCRRIPSFEDWRFLLSGSALAIIAPFNDGSVSVNTQETTVAFSNATPTSAMTGRKIKFNDNPNLYDFTFVNGTTGTINPPLSGETNVAGGAYQIFPSAYALAGDFGRFPKWGGIQYWQGGRFNFLREAQSQTEWSYRYTANPVTKPDFCQLVDHGTSGVKHVEFAPPFTGAPVIPYDYIRKLLPMRQTTSGTVSIDAGSTVVVGSAGVTKFTEAQTGWYFRIDAFGTGDESEWYRVIAITHNSSLVLQTAFGLSGAATAAYTLCAAPQMPSEVHPAILYGAAMVLLSDQNDPQFALAASSRTAVLQDARKLYRTRVNSQELEMITDEYHYRR